MATAAERARELFTEQCAKFNIDVQVAKHFAKAPGDGGLGLDSLDDVTHLVTQEDQWTAIIAQVKDPAGAAIQGQLKQVSRMRRAWLSLKETKEDVVKAEPLTPLPQRHCACGCVCRNPVGTGGTGEDVYVLICVRCGSRCCRPCVIALEGDATCAGTWVTWWSRRGSARSLRATP